MHSIKLVIQNANNPSTHTPMLAQLVRAGPPPRCHLPGGWAPARLDGKLQPGPPGGADRVAVTRAAALRLVVCYTAVNRPRPRPGRPRAQPFTGTDWPDLSTLRRRTPSNTSLCFMTPQMCDWHHLRRWRACPLIFCPLNGSLVESRRCSFDLLEKSHLSIHKYEEITQCRPFLQ